MDRVEIVGQRRQRDRWRRTTVALAALALTACGPRRGDYEMLRPDAGYPDAAILDEPPSGASNIIEDDPLEDWDTTGAGPLSGIFAVEVTVPAKVVVELESRQLFRFRLLQHGRQLRMRTQMCRIALPSVPGLAELTIPIELEMLLRSKDSESTGDYLSSDEPVGAELTPPEVNVVLGAALANPASDPLPTAASLSTALDEDADGKPGVSLLAKVLVCTEQEQAYVALRATAAVAGTVTDLDHLDGQVEASVDQSVLGYSDPGMAAATDLPIEILPGSTFQAVRVTDALDINDNGNVTCGEIVAAAAELFGEQWR